VFERSWAEDGKWLGGDEEKTRWWEGLRGAARCAVVSQNWQQKGGPDTEAVEGGTVALPKGNYGGSMMLERAAGASEGLCAPRTEREPSVIQR
jgi:hypothetical protein